MSFSLAGAVVMVMPSWSGAVTAPFIVSFARVNAQGHIGMYKAQGMRRRILKLCCLFVAVHRQGVLSFL